MLVSNQVLLGTVSDTTHISFMSPRFFSVLPAGLKYLSKKFINTIVPFAM